jgi:hypothetical protein
MNPINTSNLDDGHDLIRLARQDLLSAVQAVNLLIAEANMNARQFGIVGNGVTDDTAAFQAALNAAAGQTLTIPAPAVAYLVTGNLIVKSGTTVVGSGRACKFILKAGSGANDVFINEHRQMNSAIRDSDIKVSGLFIDGNAASQNAGYGSGVRFINVDNAELKDIVADGLRGYGIEMKCSTNIRHVRCEAYRCGDDGFSLSDGFTGTMANNTTSDVVYEDCIGSYNGTTVTGAGCAGFEIDDGPDGVTYVNCIAKGNNGRGFEIHVHGAYSNLSEMVAINGVEYRNCLAEDNAASSAFIYRNNCGFCIDSIGGNLYAKAVRYVNCTSRRHANYEFDIGPADAASGLGTLIGIMGCTMESGAYSAANTTVANRAAIRLKGCERAVITSNLMVGQAGVAAILTEDPTNELIFSNNVMSGFKRFGWIKGDDAANNASRVTVTGNMLTAPTTGESQTATGSLFVDQCSSALVANNHIDVVLTTHDSAIGFGGSFPLNHLVVANNILKASGTFNGAGTAVAINVQSTPNAIVTGNWLAGFTRGISGTGAGMVAIGNTSPDVTTLLDVTPAPAVALDAATLRSGNAVLKPGSSVTPANNGEMTFQLTSNTQLTVKVKGSDGTVRSGSLSLA